MNDCEPVVRLLRLETAEVKERLHRMEWELAGVRMTVAQRDRREAELQSQSSYFWCRKDFAKMFGTLTERERAIALAAVRYVHIERIT